MVSATVKPKWAGDYGKNTHHFIQKITVEDAETIHVHFRDSDVVLEQGLE